MLLRIVMFSLAALGTGAMAYLAGDFDLLIEELNPLRLANPELCNPIVRRLASAWIASLGLGVAAVGMSIGYLRRPRFNAVEGVLRILLGAGLMIFAALGALALHRGLKYLAVMAEFPRLVDLAEMDQTLAACFGNLKMVFAALVAGQALAALCILLPSRHAPANERMANPWPYTVTIALGALSLVAAIGALLMFTLQSGAVTSGLAAAESIRFLARRLAGYWPAYGFYAGLGLLGFGMMMQANTGGASEEELTTEAQSRGAK